jgi:acyl-coenzyme A thioesterase PaaI-like protein
LGCQLNGYPGCAHDGVLATVIDKVIGILLRINKRLGLVATGGDTVTAYLNVSYMKPVETLGTVLVSAKLKEVVRTKHFLKATIKDKGGVVLSRAEALFIGTEKFNFKGKL